jgi:hypothetical protein
MDDQATAVSVRTADAILQAARTQFTHFGYDGIGLRAIADLAGVNVALIGRYFGSKEGLFLAAVPPRPRYQGIAGRPHVDIRDARCRDHGYEVCARI